MSARGVQNDIRHQMLEIERRSAAWQSEEYRKLLEQFLGQPGGGMGQSVAQPESGQPAGSSPSHSAPATPSGPALQRQHVPPRASPMARRDDSDDDREHHQGISAPPLAELVPPRRVRRSAPRPENRELFVGTIAALCVDNSPRNRTALFSAAGLRNHQLTPQEAAWARHTPNIPWLVFSRAFGACPYAERPIARKVPAYMGSIICTNIVIQPFAPRHVGEPGVILFPPDAILLEESKETFHVLVDPSPQKRTKLQYCGIYTKVNTPNMEVQIDEWHALPSQCRTQWLKRLWKWEARDLHARCTLRKKHDSEPSPAEIQEWLRKCHDGSVAMERFTLPDSFNSGAEKFGFEVIKCVGYDVELAKLLRDKTNRLAN